MSKIHAILVLTVIGLLSAYAVNEEYLSKDDEWYGLLMAMPDRINIESSDINIVSYILTQTHRPIFERKNELSFTSQILKSWTRSDDDRLFELCPKEDMQFAMDSYFNATHLAETLRKSFKDEVAQIKINESNCVSIAFARKRQDFFKILSSLKNAPTIKTINSEIEDGLGDYRVESKTNEEIVLFRKKLSPQGINRIILRKYVDEKSFWVRQGRPVDDFNRVSFELIPDSLKAQFNSFQINQLQVALLIINVANQRDRNVLYNCIPVEKFRSAFSLDLREFSEVQTIIPFGMKGGKRGAIAQNCTGFLANKKIVFYNWKAASTDSLNKFFSDLSSRIGGHFEIRNIEGSKLIEIADNKVQGDYLTVIGVDSVNGKYEDFYFGLISPENHLPALKNQRIFQLYRQLSQGVSQNLNFLIEEIEDEIKKEMLVLPIFQPNRTFFYPHRFDFVQGGEDQSLLTPKIGDLIL